jgi:hypothetical protein
LSYKPRKWLSNGYFSQPLIVRHRNGAYSGRSSWATLNTKVFFEVLVPISVTRSHDLPAFGRFAPPAICDVELDK